MFRCEVFIFKMGHIKKEHVFKSFFPPITINAVWEMTAQTRPSTSNTNLNLVPVHVWESVALNGIPSASPLVRWSTAGGRDLYKKKREMQELHSNVQFVCLNLSNHRAHTTATLVEPQELWSNSWQALEPLIYFYHWLKTALSFSFIFTR